MGHIKSKILAVTTIALMMGAISTSQADYTSNWMSASNACFPRVFSQIDQFKVSSGGLRNTHPNVRNIICSLNFSADDNATGGVTRFPDSLRLVGISGDDMSVDMNCTIYSRDHSSGTLIEARSLVLTVGDNAVFSDESGGANIPLASNLYSTANLYLQCAVPGNGRVFGISSFFEDTLTPS